MMGKFLGGMIAVLIAIKISGAGSRIAGKRTDAKAVDGHRHRRSLNFPKP